MNMRMNTYRILLVLLCLSVYGYAEAQTPGTWTQKANSPSKRTAGISFAIGSKGYIGLGSDSVSHLNDFWEYDPATNAWTQKANYSGAGRIYASSFSLGTRGYVVGGYNTSSIVTDLWEYNPSSNAWTQKTSFPGTARFSAVGMAIGTKGYYGTGYDGNFIFADFWAYDPVNNTWTQRATLAGSSNAPRGFASSFSVSGKGYIGGGWNGNPMADFWEYDPSLNSWLQKASLQTGPASAITALSIGSKGYFIGGFSSNLAGRTNETYEYDPANDSWTYKQAFPTSPRSEGMGFVVNGKGYLCAGFSGSKYLADLLEFDPASLSAWNNSGFTGFAGRKDAASFTIGNKAYVGTGSDISNYIYSDFWEYNPDSGVWNQKADFPGGYRAGATAFSVGSKGYMGTGYNTSIQRQNDFYEFDPATNTWTQKANFAGGARNAAIGFSVGNFGYMGTGFDGTIRLNDFWQYNPANNTWTQKANVGGPERSSAVGFSMLGKGYVGTGWNGASFYKDFWEYNPANDTWAQKANFGGVGRYSAFGFGIGNRGYIGTGWIGSQVLDDMWEYNAITDAWSNRESFVGGARHEASIFSFPDRAFILIGTDNVTDFSDLWEFNPYTLRAKGLSRLTACAGDSIALGYWTAKSNLSVSFQLSDASGSFSSPVSLGIKTSGIGNDSMRMRIPTSTANGSNYRIRMVSGTDTSNLSPVVLVGGTPAVLSAVNSSFCSGESTTLNANSGSGLSFVWLKNGAVIPGTTSSINVNSSGNYRVVVSSSANCRDTSAGTVITVHPKPVVAFNINSATQCLNGNNFVFTDVSSISSGTYTSLWNLGSSASDTSSQANPVRTYGSATTYSIKLTLTSNNNCRDSLSKTVTVNAHPAVPNFIYSPDTIVCSNVPIQLQTASTDTRSWLLNGNPVGTGADTLIVNNSPGTYSLRVSNASGCTATSTKTVNLSFKPSPSKPTVSISNNVLSSSAASGNQWYDRNGIINGANGQSYTVPGKGSYYTIVTLNGCSSLPSDSLIFTAVGMHTLNKFAELEVYPNPSHGVFNIVFADIPKAPVTLSVFDLSGRLLAEKVSYTRENKIELTDLANGTYLLEIRGLDKLTRIPLLIAK